MSHDMSMLRRALGFGAVAFLVSAAAMAMTAAPAQAIGTDWYVAAATGDDSNACTSAADPCKTIAEALDRAGSNDTIHVAGGTYAESELEIFYNVTIVGAADGTTTVSGDGSEIFDVFADDGIPTVTFENLNITDNGTGDGVFAEFAAVNFINSRVDGNAHYGVEAYESMVSATHSTFNGNGTGEGYGDGIFLSVGTVTADHSTFDGNAGYGVWTDAFSLELAGVQPNAVGGSDASATLDHSTASNNGFGGVGGYDSVLQVLSSTLSGNTGAGVENDTGRASFGIVEVRNSTITGTKPLPVEETPTISLAQPSGGILSINIDDNFAAKAHSTARAQALTAHPDVAKNAAALAPHVRALTSIGDLSPGQVAVSSSIVAKQAAGSVDCAVSPKVIVDDGYNVSSDADNSCGFSADAHDVVKSDPLLGPLADNGGPTQTHLLHKGSPAIDLVPEGQDGCAADATDQRDLARVQPVGGKCDAGAVEVTQSAVVISPNSLPHGMVGKSYHQVISATGGLGAPYVWSFAGGQLPPGLTFSPGGVIGGVPTQAGTFHFTVSVDDPTLKDYTIVIEAAAVAAGGEPPLANTGPNVRPYAYLGATAVGLGILMLFTSGALGRWYRRYIRQH
jgi:hypothetical protein